jgi:hypothetical protein
MLLLHLAKLAFLISDLIDLADVDAVVSLTLFQTHVAPCVEVAKALR